MVEFIGGRTMSKAEKFIDDCTRDCSNIFEGYYPNGKQAYFPWIHPKQARKAVEIAKEELLEEICVWIKHLQVKPTYFDVDWLQREWYFERDKLIKDLKQVMKGE